MIGVEREALFAPLLQNLHESAGGQIRLNVEFQRLTDALSGLAGGEQGTRVVDDEAAGDIDGNDLAAPAELPLERTPRNRIAEPDAFVATLGEVQGVRGAAAPGDVVRRRAGQDAGFQQQSRDQRRGLRLAEADGDIEALR